MKKRTHDDSCPICCAMSYMKREDGNDICLDCKEITNGKCENLLDEFYQVMEGVSEEELIKFFNRSPDSMAEHEFDYWVENAPSDKIADYIMKGNVHW